ncbi:MAG TPA: type II secretion system protein [Candidatus Saccharimonadales bacterium]
MIRFRSLKKQSAGFTVIELAVVAVVLGILLTLVALTYNGVQAKNRNNQRQSNINTLQTQLETYYAASANGEYPTLAQLNDPSWRAKNLPKLTTDIISDPRWSVKTNCTADKQPILSVTPAVDCYAYQVTDAGGDACNDTTEPCAHYTLTATLEGGQLTYVKSSLN